jgi:hypothetical protein
MAMTATGSDLRVIVLDWLAGRSGCAKGERVLVRSFGGAYLGVVEPGNEEKGGDYICCYYLKDGQECESSRRSPPGKDEIVFSHDCEQVINDLILAKIIGWKAPPPEHDGIAVYAHVPDRELVS